MNEKKNCHYHFVITEIDNETGEAQIVHDELHDNLYFVGMDHESDRFTECMLNTNLVDVAMMLAQASKGSTLCNLARAFKPVIRDEKASFLEELLGGAIEGGIQ